MFSVFLFLFVCIFLYFLMIFFFLSFLFFVFLFSFISQRIVPNDEQQTNKQKIQSFQLALHSLKEVWGWNGELSSKQLDEHRGGRRKKVNKVHEG